MKWLYTFIIPAIFYTAGDYFSKLYSINGQLKWYILAAVSFFGTTVTWLYALKHSQTLAITGTIYTLTSLIVGCLIGVFLFNETLQIHQIIGICLAFTAAILLCI